MCVAGDHGSNIEQVRSKSAIENYGCLHLECPLAASLIITPRFQNVLSSAALYLSKSCGTFNSLKFLHRRTKALKIERNDHSKPPVIFS